MKLQDALRKIVRNRGLGALKDSRLVSFLSDYEAFADFPDMRQVMAAISEKGSGSELFRISQEGSLPKTVSYAQGLAKSLPKDLGISEEYARYASDCIVFALGLAVTVKEPSLRRADPKRSSSREQNAAAGRGAASSPGGAGAESGKRKDERPDARTGKAVSPDDTVREVTGSGSARSGNENSGGSPGAGKTDGEGEERICPRCGAKLTDFCLCCPACGEKVEPEEYPGGGSGAEGSSGDKASPFIWACYVLGLLCGFFSQKGRLARGEWWIRWIILVTFFCSFEYLYNTLTAGSGPIDPFTFRFAIAFSAVTLTGLSAFFLSVRRLHDLNLSGWWAFLLAVLYFCTGQDAIPALFLIWLSFAGGTKGPNRFGPDPMA
jgi:uncharacterized membrane protein YhaH (DUF805 family)